MDDDQPVQRSATWHVLTEGYVEPGVAGTVVLVRDGDVIAVIDPGMVADRSRILDPLAEHGISPDEVTDVVFSHHHPDHTLNAALFPSAQVHDYQAVYRNDMWTSRPADGVLLTPSLRLLHVPGHTPEDIATVVGSAEGVAVCTHAWWYSDGPPDDPYAPDRDLLRRARERILAVADVVIPGHGAPFSPGAATPR